MDNNKVLSQDQIKVIFLTLIDEFSANKLQRELLTDEENSKLLLKMKELLPINVPASEMSDKLDATAKMLLKELGINE